MAQKGAHLDMMAFGAEIFLVGLAGAVAGAGLMAWILRHAQRRGSPETAGNEASELDRLKEHQQAWEVFATSSVHLIPILMKQMKAVTAQTERAALDLMVQIREVTSPDRSSTDAPANLSKIVMAMQFQDITQQKLEHVAQALDQWHKHLQALLKGPQSESARQEIVILQTLEQSYTMEEERRLHAEAITPDYQEPVPIETEETEEEPHVVTLF